MILLKQQFYSNMEVDYNPSVLIQKIFAEGCYSQSQNILDLIDPVLLTLITKSHHIVCYLDSQYVESRYLEGIQNIASRKKYSETIYVGHTNIEQMIYHKFLN